MLQSVIPAQECTNSWKFHSGRESRVFTESCMLFAVVLARQLECTFTNLHSRSTQTYCTGNYQLAETASWKQTENLVYVWWLLEKPV